MTTGSLINNLYSGAGGPEPEIGMGATVLHWTDRTACTIVEIPNATTIVVQPDKTVRTDGLGMSDAQSYDYSPNPDARKYRYTLRKNGTWVTEGQSMKSGTRIAVGVRDSYYDYSF